MELDKEIWMPESGTYSFQMIFPPLPENTTNCRFSLKAMQKEDLVSGESIWTVNRPLLPSPEKRIRKETPVLEMPELKSGVATLKGHIAGYRPEMKLGGSTWTFNPITGNADENQGGNRTVGERNN